MALDNFQKKIGGRRC